MAAAYLERMGERIRTRREQLGLSRGEVARRMPGKTNENAIYRWEKGLHRANPDALEALAAVLEVETAYFMATSSDDGHAPGLMEAIADGSKPEWATDLESSVLELREGLTAKIDEMEVRRQDIAEVVEGLLRRQDVILSRIEAMLAGAAAAAAQAAAEEVTARLRARLEADVAQAGTPDEAPQPARAKPRPASQSRGGRPRRAAS